MRLDRTSGSLRELCERLVKFTKVLASSAPVQRSNDDWTKASWRGEPFVWLMARERGEHTNSVILHAYQDDAFKGWTAEVHEMRGGTTPLAEFVTSADDPRHELRARWFILMAFHAVQRKVFQPPN